MKQKQKFLFVRLIIPLMASLLTGHRELPLLVLVEQVVMILQILGESMNCPSSSFRVVVVYKLSLDMLHFLSMESIADSEHLKDQEFWQLKKVCHDVWLIVCKVFQLIEDNYPNQDYMINR